MSITESAIPGIQFVTQEAMGSIPDRELALAVNLAFEQEKTSLIKVQNYFQKLTSSLWTKRLLDCFFHAWRDMHLSSSSVAAMTCRLLSMAEHSYDNRHSFFQAAHANAKIIHEDLGLCGERHARTV